MRNFVFLCLCRGLWRGLFALYVLSPVAMSAFEDVRLASSVNKVLRELDEKASAHSSASKTQNPPHQHASLSVRLHHQRKIPEASHDVTVHIKNPAPQQGESISISIESAHKIWKCFGNLGGQSIPFVDVADSLKYQGFLGFALQHYTGKLKLLLAIFFRDGTLRYIAKEITVRERYVPKVRAWVYKKQRRLVKYKRRGKWRRRWKTIRKRYRRWITPPQNERDFKHTTLGDFQKEVRAQVIDLIESGEALGGGTEKYDRHSDIVEQKIQEEDFKETALFNDLYQVKTPYKFYDGHFYQPLYPEKHFRVSGFGKYRVFRYKGRTRRGYHKGLDISQPKGTLLYAPNHGMVVLARYFRARGNVVMLDHGAGVYSLQYHLSKILVQEGTFVRKGQVVGRVGSTGISTGPHLHWEMRVQGVAVNPIQWRNVLD